MVKGTKHYTVSAMWGDTRIELECICSSCRPIYLVVKHVAQHLMVEGIIHQTEYVEEIKDQIGQKNYIL